MKRKRILFTMMAMLLTLSFMPSSIHAQETATSDIPAEMIWDKDKLQQYTNTSVYIYPVAMGTSPTTQIGYIRVLQEDGIHTQGLIPLTGDMLESFETSSAPGMRSTKLKGTDYTIDYEVVEKVQMENAGKPASIGTDVDKIGENIADDNNDFTATISVLDDRGNNIYSVELKKENILSCDRIDLGTNVYHISYLGLDTTLNIVFHKYELFYYLSSEGKYYGDTLPRPIFVPVGADLKNVSVFYNPYRIDENDKIYTYDGNPVSRGALGSIYDLFPSELIAQVDTSKAGVYEVDGIVSDGRRAKGRVVVGKAAQSTIEELLPQEAQATMPAAKQDVLSVWDIPSGEAGAGTWVFATGLNKGSTVNVWSYHNQNWLKIGTYTVDQDGNITVAFRADQLSPVILTKGDVKADDQKDVKKTDDIVKKTSEGKQSSNVMVILTVFTLLGLAIFVSAEKKKQNN